jgi:hypothetical protein
MNFKHRVGHSALVKLLLVVPLMSTMALQLYKYYRLEPIGGGCLLGCRSGVCLGGGLYGYCTQKCKGSSNCPEHYFCNKDRVCQHEPSGMFGDTQCQGVPDICFGKCVSLGLESFCTDSCKTKADCPSGYECDEIDSEARPMEWKEERDRACISHLYLSRRGAIPDLAPKGKMGAWASDGCDSGRWIGNKLWGYCTAVCSSSTRCPPSYRCNREGLCEKRVEKPSVEFGGMCDGRASVCLSGICVSVLAPEIKPPPSEYYPLDWCTDPCDEKRGCPSGYECREFEGLATKVCNPRRPAKIRDTLKYFVTTREKELREASEDRP